MSLKCGHTCTCIFVFQWTLLIGALVGGHEQCLRKIESLPMEKHKQQGLGTFYFPPHFLFLIGPFVIKIDVIVLII